MAASRVAAKPLGADEDELGADTDEGVGSLPVVVAPEKDNKGLAGTLNNVGAFTAGQSHSSILITGTWNDIRAVVIDSFGDGFIYVAPTRTLTPAVHTRPTLPAVTGIRDHRDSEPRFDFRFFGNIELELDLVELELRGIEPKLRTSDDFYGGLSTVCSGGLCSPITEVPASSQVSFSLGALLSSNALLGDGVQLLAIAANMNAITLDLSLSSAYTLKIVQGVAWTASN